MNAPAQKHFMLESMLNDLGIRAALDRDITEFAINRPGEYWLQAGGVWTRHEEKALTWRNLSDLAVALKVANNKTLDAQHPARTLTLPRGERCQVVLPPVCEDGTLSMTVRKASPVRFGLPDWARTGRLSPARARFNATLLPWETRLLELYEAGDFEAFFQGCAAHHLNVVTVGGTGSGKTTFSKTLADLYPADRRIFTLEERPELDLPQHPNHLHLFYSADFPCRYVLAAAMRMKPDHIFLTELLGDETWDYLMALKSGHAGSVTSVHANDCRSALHKIASYVKQSEVGRSLDMGYLLDEVRSIIDVVVYFEDTYLKEIWYDPKGRLALLQGERA